VNGGLNKILISLARLKICQKLLKKSRSRQKENFSDSINSMIAEKAFDLWQKAEK